MKTLSLAIVLLAVLTATAQGPSKATGDPVARYTALEFKRLIRASIVDVEKLTGKRVEITGVVDTIKKNSSNPKRYNLYFRDEFGSYIGDFVCLFETADDLKNAKGGQETTVRAQVYFGSLRPELPLLIYSELR